MPYSTSFAKSNSNTFLASALAQYLAGQIAENTWQQLMSLLDSEELPAGEREAAAASLLHGDRA